jgi:hypothetical protein
MEHQAWDDREPLERCEDCGAEIATGSADRSYTVSDESVICFGCAIRRGGTWDEGHGRWSADPGVGDLLERERPT